METTRLLCSEIFVAGGGQALGCAELLPHKGTNEIILAKKGVDNKS